MCKNALLTNLLRMRKECATNVQSGKEFSAYSGLTSVKELRKLVMVLCIALFLLKYDEKGKKVMFSSG